MKDLPVEMLRRVLKVTGNLDIPDRELLDTFKSCRLVSSAFQQQTDSVQAHVLSLLASLAIEKRVEAATPSAIMGRDEDNDDDPTPLSAPSQQEQQEARQRASSDPAAISFLAKVPELKLRLVHGRDEALAVLNGLLSLCTQLEGLELIVGKRLEGMGLGQRSPLDLENLDLRNPLLARLRIEDDNMEGPRREDPAVRRRGRQQRRGFNAAHLPALFDLDASSFVDLPGMISTWPLDSYPAQLESLQLRTLHLNTTSLARFGCLRRLSLASADLQDSDLAVIDFPSLPLEHLDFHKNRLTDLTVQRLQLHRENSTLRKLSLSSNHLSRASCLCLDSNTSLRVLDLCSAFGSTARIGPLGLDKNNTLHTLTISYTHVSGMQAVGDALLQLSTELRSNTALKALEVSHPVDQNLDLPPPGALHIGNNTSIKNMVLQCFYHRDGDYPPLIDLDSLGLNTNKTLTRLYIGGDDYVFDEEEFAPFETNGRQIIDHGELQEALFDTRKTGRVDELADEFERVFNFQRAKA